MPTFDSLQHHLFYLQVWINYKLEELTTFHNYFSKLKNVKWENPSLASLCGLVYFVHPWINVIKYDFFFFFNLSIICIYSTLFTSKYQYCHQSFLSCYSTAHVCLELKIKSMVRKSKLQTFDWHGVIQTLLLCWQVVGEFGMAHFSDKGKSKGKDYCIFFNSQWARLPQDLNKAVSE